MAERVEEAVVEGTLTVRRVRQDDLLNKVAKFNRQARRNYRHLPKGLRVGA